MSQRIFALLVAFVVLVTLPYWMAGVYYVNVASQILFYAIFAIGLNVLAGYGGLVSLGHAGLFGVTAYATGYMLQLGFGHTVSIIAALIVGLIAMAIYALLSLRSTGIGFINGDHLVNAVHEPARDRIFKHAGTLCRCALYDKDVARQRVDRERADVRHATARALIRPAVPFIGCLLGLVGGPFAQGIELESQLLPQHRLRIGKEWPGRIDAAR